MKQNEVNRNVWSLFEAGKDNVEKVLIAAVVNKQINIDRSLLPMLLIYVKDSLDQTFSRGFKVLEKTIQKAISDARDDLPDVPKAPPKKKIKKN